MPTTPTARGSHGFGESEVFWPEALEEVRSRLSEIASKHGPESIAFLGSGRASLEADFLLKCWAGDIGSSQVVFEVHPRRDQAARAAAARPQDLTRSLEEVRGSDFLLLLGADPLSEGPMLALAVRQAVRRGARAAILDPRPVELLCEAAHLPLAPEKLSQALEALESGDFSAFSRQERIFLEGLAASLKGAERPVLIGGGDLARPRGGETPSGLGPRPFKQRSNLRRHGPSA